MKIKFMIGSLTYLSVALFHKCHAGGVNSTPAVDINDERRAPARQRTTLPHQPITTSAPLPTTTTSFKPAPLPVVPPPQQDLSNDQSRLPSQSVIQPAPLPTTTPSSEPAPKPVVHPPQQVLGEALKSTPSSMIKSQTSTDERAIVPYKMLKFRGHEIPYPQSAQVKVDEKSSLLLKQAVCSITLLTAEQRKTHELAQKMESNSAVPKSPEALNGYFEKIYADLTRIGGATANVESAEEAIQTLKKLVQHVKLSEIYADTKFQRNPTSLISRVMITMNSGGEGIILNVHGLPQELWAQ